jgi:hypothetical protein
MERGETYREFWWGNLKEGDHLGDPGINGKVILRWMFKNLDVGVWIGSSWLRLSTCGRHV